MCDSLLNDEYLRHAKNPMPGGDGLISETQGGRIQRAGRNCRESSWIYTHDLGRPVNGMWFPKAVYTIGAIET